MVMRSYSRLKVADIRQLCDDRGLRNTGMSKPIHDGDGRNDNMTSIRRLMHVLIESMTIRGLGLYLKNR